MEILPGGNVVVNSDSGQINIPIPTHLLHSLMHMDERVDDGVAVLHRLRNEVADGGERERRLVVLTVHVERDRQLRADLEERDEVQRIGQLTKYELNRKRAYIIIHP